MSLNKHAICALFAASASNVALLRSGSASSVREGGGVGGRKEAGEELGEEVGEVVVEWVVERVL